jgi:hypothetical protein
MRLFGKKSDSKAASEEATKPTAFPSSPNMGIVRVVKPLFRPDWESVATAQSI